MSFTKNLILVFSLDGIKFAVDVENLVEVSVDVEASYSDEIEGYLGTIRLRDNEIKILNVQRRLGLNQTRHKKDDFVVVNAGKELIAIPVDSVEGVIRIEGRTFPFPEIMMDEAKLFPCIYDWSGEFILNVNLNSLLDPGRNMHQVGT